MIKKTFAKNLHALRKEKGFTQSKLAEKADMSLRHYADIEAGKTWPSPEKITALAGALDISYLRLFSEEAAKPIPPEIVALAKKITELQNQIDSISVNIPEDILKELNKKRSDWDLLRSMLGISKKNQKSKKSEAG